MRSHRTTSRREALAADSRRRTQDDRVKDTGGDLWKCPPPPQSDKSGQPHEDDLIRLLSAQALTSSLTSSQTSQDTADKIKDSRALLDEQHADSSAPHRTTTSRLHRQIEIRWPHIVLAVLVGGLLGMGIRFLILSSNETETSSGHIPDLPGRVFTFEPSTETLTSTQPSLTDSSAPMTSSTATEVPLPATVTEVPLPATVTGTPLPATVTEVPLPAPTSPPRTPAVTSAKPSTAPTATSTTRSVTVTPNASTSPTTDPLPATPTKVGNVQVPVSPKTSSAAWLLYNSGPTQNEYNSMFKQCLGMGGNYLAKTGTGWIRADYSAHTYSVTWEFGCWSGAAG
jgi:hypothetical protein